MLKTFRASKSNIVVWVLLVLLIIGLAGFGIGTVGGGGQAVAQVGDTRVDADDYARALDQEIRAISTQLGRHLPMAEARGFGIDRLVLARLVNDAALDDEARRLGISTGDGSVQELVLATPAFRGADGNFDRQAYAFALERIRMTPAEFEELLRAETARELVAGGLQSAVAMPAAAAEALLGHAAERRGFDWLALDAGLLPEPVPAPGEAEIEAQYAAAPDRYMRPETRRITYAALEPAALAATIEIPEEELRAAYAAAGARFDAPERRIVDRIGFGDAAEAEAALARIEAGEIDFDALAAERRLSEAAMDQGALTRAELSAEAAEAVFGAEGPGIVGPVATPLGPSLYRINAILAAQVTPFEAARAELREERALEQARQEIREASAGAVDMIAGGARIEEIVAETPFEAGEIALDATTTGGLADDPAFRELVEAADVGVETDLAELASGGLVTLRVDEVEAPAPIPLAEIRDRVAADWTAAETVRRTEALARELKAEVEGGLAFADLAARLGRTPVAAAPLTRDQLTPDAADGLVAAVFAAPEGGVVVAADGARVTLAQVTEIAPFDPAAPDSAALVADVSEQLRTAAAEDVLALTVQAAQLRAGMSVNQPLVEQILAQIP